MLKKIWLNLTSFTVSVIIIGLGIMGFILFFFIRPTTHSLAYTPIKQSVAVVTLAKAQSYSPQVILYATIQSTQHATLAARVAGNVLQLLVRDGNYVHKNQRLLVLDISRIRLEVNQLQAKVTEMNTTIEQQQLRYHSDLKTLGYQKNLLTLKEKSLQRKGSLNNKGYSSQEILEQEQQRYIQQQLQLHKSDTAIHIEHHKILALQQQLLQLQAKLKQSQLDMSYGTVRSPFDGTITKVYVATGTYVKPGESLLAVLSSDDLEARALIPNKFLDTLIYNNHHAAPVTAQAVVQGRKIPLQLKRIAGQVKLGQLGREAIFHILTNSRLLVSGQRFVLTLNLPHVKHSYVLPISCLYGKDKIYVIKNGALQVFHVQVHGKIYQKDRTTAVVVTSSELDVGVQVLKTQLPGAITGLLVKVKS